MKKSELKKIILEVLNEASGFNGPYVIKATTKDGKRTEEWQIRARGDGEAKNLARTTYTDSGSAAPFKGIFAGGDVKVFNGQGKELKIRSWKQTRGY